MAVKMRLKRMGRKNRAFFRICVSDGRFMRDGRTVEDLGFYDPLADKDEQKYNLNKERAAYWLSVGAQPSETVVSILKKFEVELPEFIRLTKSARQKAKKRAKAKAEKGDKGSKKKK